MSVKLFQPFLVLRILILTIHIEFSKCDKAFIDGDMYIIGLFDVFDGQDGSCLRVNTDSVMVLEAVRWYTGQLNKANVFPFKIGFEGYMTCGMPSRAVYYTGLEMSREDVIGIIGASSNEEAKAVADLLKATELPQISLGATATELGNRTIYPNFYRILPDETKQIMIIVRLSEFLNWERMAVVYENTVYKQIAAALNQQLKANSVSVPKFIEIGKHTSAIALRKRLQGLLEDILTYSPFIEAVVYFGCKHTATVLFQVVQAEQETNAAYIPRFVLPETNAWDGDIFRYLGFDPLVAKHGPLIITPPYEEITCFSEYWFSLFTNMTQFDMVSTHNAWLNNVFALESEPHCNPKFKACLPFGANDADKKFSYQTLNVKYGIIAAHAMVKALKNIYDMACPADKSNCTLSEFKSVLNRRRGMLLNEMNNLEIHFGSDFNVTAGPLTTSNYTVIFHDKTEPVYSSDNEVYEVYTFGEISSHNLEKSYITKVGSFNYNDTLILNVSEARVIHDWIRQVTTIGQQSEKSDAISVQTLVFGCVIGCLVVLVGLLLQILYRKTKQLKDSTYITPHSRGEEPQRLAEIENSVPCSPQNSRATQNEATNPYDELSCTTVQQQSDTDIQLGDGENDFILHPLGACGLTEEVCREFPCTEELTICDSQRLWDSV